MLSCWITYEYFVGKLNGFEEILLLDSLSFPRRNNHAVHISHVIHCDPRYYYYEIFMPYVFKMSIAIH